MGPRAGDMARRSSISFPPSLPPCFPPSLPPYRDIQVGLLGKLRVQGRGQEAVVPPRVHLILDVQNGGVILGGREGGKEGRREGVT